MYRAVLTSYVVPLQGEGFIGKPGNLRAVISAVNTIYHALNAKAIDYDVLIEGVNPANLDDLLFSVDAETVLAGSSTTSGEVEITPYKLASEYNLAPKVDLPSLSFVLDSLVDDQVTEDQFHTGKSELVNANLRIGKSPVDGSWVIRIYSKAVKYEIQINNSPEYFDRAVTVDIEVDEFEVDDEDRRAILEVATVLADQEFRDDGRYDLYCNAKRGKPVTKFELFELSGLDSTGSDLEIGLHRVLRDDHYSAEDFLALSEDNLRDVVPRYLVMADKLRRESSTLRSQLALDISRYQFQRAQMQSDQPRLDAVLDVTPFPIEGIEKAVGEHLGELRDLKDLGEIKTDAHRVIRDQLVEYDSRMRSNLNRVEKCSELLLKMERAGIVRSQGFDQLRFYSRAARSGINELAIEALVLLNSFRGEGQ